MTASQLVDRQFFAISCLSSKSVALQPYFDTFGQCRYMKAKTFVGSSSQTYMAITSCGALNSSTRAALLDRIMLRDLVARVIWRALLIKFLRAVASAHVVVAQN